MCPHYFIPEWNLFDYTMKESRRLDIIETLRIHTSIEALSEWFKTDYLSNVFRQRDYVSDLLAYSEHQQALDTIAASNRSNKETETI